MRLIRCDRCHKEILPAQINRIGYVALNWRHILTDDLEDGNPYEHCDFCPECMKAISDFIETNPVAVSPLLEKNQDMKEEPADPEPAAEPAAADKKKSGEGNRSIKGPSALYGMHTGQSRISLKK